MLTQAPIYVNWNYTYACNFNCSHCYSRSSMYPPELSVEQYQKLSKEMVDIGVFKVGLGGGEPVIRRDHLSVIETLSAGNVHTNITTNGWLISKQRAQTLADAGLSTMYISIDSMDSGKHDLFRRRPQSFNRAVVAVENARLANIPVILSTVLTKINYQEIQAFAEFAAKHDIQGIEFKRFRPAGNGLDHISEYSTSGEPEKIIRESIATAKAAQPGVKIDLVYGAEPNGDDAGCPCGTKSIVLRPNGDLSTCAYSENVVGNVANSSIEDVWQNSESLSRIRCGVSCLALQRNPNPSNPALTTAGQLDGSESRI